MTPAMRSWRDHSDLALVLFVVLILLILFTPIPAAGLDLCIIVNVALALTILLLTFYVVRPVEFSTFPSLLLIATLFRLSLNIAATRLILSGAHAGQVIGAIGEFVVQGNVVIGLIIFFILIVVQYVVVTSGAQRVSEVAARFVLDAMPGQQMSIDADLNMGLIDQDEAKQRRKALEKEAGFYGSMDGASKFVKGDAIAGILIMLINILGGWAVGVAQMGMPWAQALRTFTLLTIGDGIVTQVPALIISVATGIIVTRSSADGQLSHEVLRQLVQFPKIQWLVMIALVGLLLLPGMPKWPVALLAPIALGTAYAARRQRAQANAQAAASPSDQVLSEQTDGLPAVAAIEIVLGAALSRAWMPMQSVLTERIAAFRKQYAADMGLVVPAVVFRDDAQLAANDYRLLLFGNRWGHATLYPDKTMAIRASDKGEPIPGAPTKDPAFGLPAVWIDADAVAHSKVAGYTPVDAITVLLTHVMEVIKANAATLLSRTDVIALLEGVRSRQPGLVEELVPNLLAISDVQQVLQALLSEQVPIRHLDRIVEILVDAGRVDKDPASLAERIRQRLGHTICQAIQGDHESLAVLTLEPGLEATLGQNMQGTDGAAGFLLDPRLAESFLSRLMAQVDAMMRQNLMPVLLCRPEVRRHLKTFTHRVVPRLTVLAMNEVPHAITLKAFGTVHLDSLAAPLSSGATFHHG